MVLPDVFSAALDPVVERAAVAALSAVGYRVSMAPFVPSGKFDHVKGRRNRFARAARAQERIVRSILDTGATPAVIEPAVGLLHGHEYPAIQAGYPRGVRHLAELLDDRRHRLGGGGPTDRSRRDDRLAAPGEGGERAGADRPVVLLGHCTERATAPHLLAAWTRVLEAAGHRVEVPAVGCCGMAGIFGHEIENQEMSRQLWAASWADQIDRADASTQPAPVLAATGYSCRSQALRLAGRRLVHPTELLLTDLG